MKIKYFALALVLILSLVFSCALAPFEVPVQAEERVYTYMVEITFGPFAFYYDYGIWDVSELDYVKSESSVNPSKNTEDGLPGWYGFNGNTNRVSVTYQDTEGENVASSIDVSVEFTLSKVSGTQITGVALSGYTDPAFTDPLPSKDVLSGEYSSGYKFSVPNTYKKGAEEGEGIPTNTYFSLDGTPMVGGEKLKTVSETALLGTITISIDTHNPAP